MINSKKMLPKKIFKFFSPLLFIVLFSQQVFAHNLWIETNPTGEVGESHKVSIYLGEYSYGIRDDITENKEMIGEISIWLIKPNDEIKKIESQIDGNRFVAQFIPDEKGIHHIALRITDAPVVDWRDYNLGILKTNFFSSASVSVGNTGNLNLQSTPVTDKNKLVLTPTEDTSFNRENPTSFKVLYDGEPLAEQKVVVGYKDQWFKTLYTDKDGKISLSLPWEKQYVIETVYTEEEPGSFQGDEYEAIRHTATYRIPPATK